MTLAIDRLHAEVEQIRAEATATKVALEAEKAEHERTKKALRAAQAREAKARAQADQKGPVDSENERWLLMQNATAEWRRSPFRGESVLLTLRRGGRVRAASLEAALSEARERFDRGER